MKSVLLAVCGLSPQVVTETLYALLQQGRLPDAVRIITTRRGRETCLAQLLDPEQGAYSRFLSDYSIDPGRIDFGPTHVRAVTTPQGRQIDDIADDQDNEHLLRACMEAAFEWTANSDCAVFFSIAGGRKTMGACLGAAAQCYGRPQDRLYHVLVSPEFESSRDFFYPPPKPRQITLYDAQGQPYRKSSRYAKVNLVPLPFVSIRPRLTPDHLRNPEHPATLLASLVREERPVLTVDVPAGKLLWKQQECDLPPTQMALYAFFARQKKIAACIDGDCPGCSACLLAMPEILNRQVQIAEIYRHANPQREEESLSHSGILALDADNLRSYRAKLCRRLQQAFGVQVADEIAPLAFGARPETRYGLPLGRDRLRLVL